MLAPLRVGGLAALALAAALCAAGAETYQLRRFVAGVKAPEAPACDDSWDSVVLLLDGEGASVADATGRHTSPTLQGTAVTLSTDARFGAGSLEFTDLYGSALDFGSDADFNLGTGDFTIEAWVKTGAASTRAILAIGPEDHDGGGALTLVLNQLDEGVLVARLNNNSGNNWDATLASPGDVGVNSSGWTHVALTRAGTAARTFVNGQIVASATISGSLSLTAGQKLVVGGVTTGSGATYRMSGWMDDVRVTKGVARYTEAFAPPTEGFASQPCAGG